MGIEFVNRCELCACIGTINFHYAYGKRINQDGGRGRAVAGVAHHMLEWAASGSLELVLKLKLIVMSLHKELQCKARGKKKQQTQRRGREERGGSIAECRTVDARLKTRVKR